jgi:hypothetical protein
MNVRLSSATRYRIANMFQSSRLCTMALLLIIGGCAGPMGTIHSDTPPPPPVTTFDGTYRGTIRNTGAADAAQGSSWCDTPGQPIITVVNGQFTYTVPHPNITTSLMTAFPATIAPDGSFYGEIITGSLSGRVDGTHIEGKIDGSACIYTFSGDRI